MQVKSEERGREKGKKRLSRDCEKDTEWIESQIKTV